MNDKKINKFKIALNIFYGIVIFFLVFVAGVIAISTINTPGNIKLFSVQSGSMEPSVHTGSIVVTRPESSYKVGDIFTFYNNENSKSTVTHRINATKEISGQKVYISKGDANNAPDTTPVTAKQIVGKVLFAIPLIGYPVMFARTQTGLIILIIIPATIIIYSELINIKNEFINLIKKKKVEENN